MLVSLSPNWRGERTPVPGVFSLVPFDAPVGEMRVAETSADGQHAPPADVVHVGHFAQPLNDGIVVHQHDRLMSTEPFQALRDLVRQVETLTLPVAWEVLAAAQNGA